jgi:hypothetical protein
MILVRERVEKREEGVYPLKETIGFTLQILLN